MMNSKWLRISSGDKIKCGGEVESNFPPPKQRAK